MKSCNNCGGFPWECDCAVLDEVVGHTPDGYPVDREGLIVTAKCTPAQRRALNEALIPNYNFNRKQAGELA